MGALDLHICSFIAIAVGFIFGAVVRSGPYRPFWNSQDASDYTILGTTLPGFEFIKYFFEINFINGWEKHAQLVVYHDGNVLANLYGKYYSYTVFLGGRRVFLYYVIQNLGFSDPPPPTHVILE
jgi:hypothetical protein